MKRGILLGLAINNIGNVAADDISKQALSDWLSEACVQRPVEFVYPTQYQYADSESVPFHYFGTGIDQDTIFKLPDTPEGISSVYQYSFEKSLEDTRLIGYEEMKRLQEMQGMTNEFERRLGIMQANEAILLNSITTMQKVVDIRGMGNRRLHGENKKISGSTPMLRTKMLKDSRPLVEMARKMKAIEGMQPQVLDFEKRATLAGHISPYYKKAVELLRDIVDTSGMCGPGKYYNISLCQTDPPDPYCNRCQTNATAVAKASARRRLRHSANTDKTELHEEHSHALLKAISPHVNKIHSVYTNMLRATPRVPDDGLFQLMDQDISRDMLKNLVADGMLEMGFPVDTNNVEGGTLTNTRSADSIHTRSRDAGELVYDDVYDEENTDSRFVSDDTCSKAVFGVQDNTLMFNRYQANQMQITTTSQLGVISKDGLWGTPYADACPRAAMTRPVIPDPETYVNTTTGEMDTQKLVVDMLQWQNDYESWADFDRTSDPDGRSVAKTIETMPVFEDFFEKHKAVIQTRDGEIVLPIPYCASRSQPMDKNLNETKNWMGTPDGMGDWMQQMKEMQPQINDLERRISIMQSLEPVIDSAVENVDRVIASNSKMLDAVEFSDSAIHYRRRLATSTQSQKLSSVLKNGVAACKWSETLKDSDTIENCRKMKAIEGMQSQVDDMTRRIGLMVAIEPLLENLIKMTLHIVDVRGMGKKRRRLTEVLGHKEVTGMEGTEDLGQDITVYMKLDKLRLGNSDAAVATTAAIKNIQKALTARILKRLDDAQPLVEVARKMKAIEGMQPQINDMARRLGGRHNKDPGLADYIKLQPRLKQAVDKVEKYIVKPMKQTVGDWWSVARVEPELTKKTGVKNVQKELTRRIVERLNSGQPTLNVAGQVHHLLKAESDFAVVNNIFFDIIDHDIEVDLEHVIKGLQKIVDVRGM